MCKFDGKFDTSIQDDFIKKQIILTDTGGKDMSEDEATEIALTVGAEDVNILQDEEAFLKFTCDPLGVQKIEKELEASTHNLTILSSRLEHIPPNPLDLSGRDVGSVELFLQALYKTASKDEINFQLSDISHNINNITTTFQS